MIDSVLSLFDVPALWTVAPGAALLGAAAGVVGCFAVLRRQSLQGDVVSHAALPGVALAFLLGGRSPLLLVLGGAVAGWAALVLVGVIGRRSRVPEDAALGGTLAVFFGLGLALLREAQSTPGAGANPLDRYLFGQAANLREGDLWVIGGLGAGVVLVVVLAWTRLKVLAFDPDYAASTGLPVRGLDLLLTTLTVVAVVIGLKAVGIVLMTALLVAPAAAARQWTDRLGVMVLLAAALGAASGAGGTFLAHHLGVRYRAGVPTGPTIVLVASAFVAFSLAFGAARGLVWNLWRRAPVAAGP
ncbi:abc-3 protein : ABC-3 protein OS=Herpetosiphon aurantiacus (strain ATCC 23779 / DSM 785) GN=Haur_4028 PE=3 SV=1: ABC-3 [Gemmataceae bacterium]|nr:abc-3 protein : ABC-3 protein OS=Herpetosiphon aurantiacus (strain ATCC 23779 / DSM 785) GN=Haur_4028 PE=3 SV=1: ABC-3 [Gemmataceae bacterium]VTU00060.1 abc-3 protein : ABC-3 protein OS=Herpetosiphon aurantiacus (strain ATCC 23779 / DSM 785) GN=Haur_4028 PE=3 SV=1: ABC-3 [Gemmataceae bacterium]